MLIHRPRDIGGMIHWHGADRLPLGCELDVPAEQCALFVRDGVVLGMLMHGRYRLDPHEVPFLGMALEPSPHGPTLRTLVAFVPIEPHPGVEVRARLGKVEGPSAPGFAIAMRTLVTLRVDDPFRLVTYMLSLAAPHTLEEIVASQLAPRLATIVSGMAGAGEVPIGTIGGAALGAVKDALHAGSFSLDEMGVQVVDVTALELRPDHVKPAPAEAPGAIPWGLRDIPFHDAPTGRGVYIAAHGCFEGPPLPPDVHDWIRGLIAHAVHQSASSYTGSVVDLPGRVDEWSAWLTQAVAPMVEQQTGARGRVVVAGVQVQA